MKQIFALCILLLMACAPGHLQKQLSQLPQKQKNTYIIMRNTIKVLGSKEEMAEFEKISSIDSVALREFEALFWKKRDPNPMTPENEMRAEFDKRLQFVLDNFPLSNYFKPWDERGDTYLKLGPPTERKTRLTPSIYSEIIIQEEWIYTNITNEGRPLTFVFQSDKKIVGGYVSIPVTNLSEDAPFFFNRSEYLQHYMVTRVTQVEQRPMLYFYDYGKEELKYAFGLTPFLIRETPNIYDIYLTINAPAQKLVTPSLDSLRYTWRVLVQDENYERLFEDSSEGISYLGSKNGELKNLVIIDQKELNLKAGTYIITSELVNSDRNKGGLLQNKLVLPPYRFPKEIELSKAILAKEIRVADSLDSKFVRNGLVIKPWVTSVFNPAETFWLYFEIYNLPLDREGKSHFTVRYYLQDLLSGKKYLVSERSVRQEQRDYAIVQSFSDSLFQTAKIPIKTGKDYVLLTEIKDEILGKKVQSLSTMFKFKKA